jgi:hypothetical protein
MIGRGIKWRMAVRLVTAFALVLLSFAHKPALAKGLSPAVAAEYLLPDGTFADICFGTEGVDHDARDGKAPSIAPICEACRLAASILLPTPTDECMPAENGNWLAKAPIVEAEAALAPLRLLPPSRGPPRLS